jgi:hypothetical protein
MLMGKKELKKYLKQHKDDVNINLFCQSIGDNELIILANFIMNNKILKKLDLGNNEINDISPLFEALRYNAALEDLNIKANSIEKIDKIISLQHNTSLKLLDLSLNNIKNIEPLVELLKVNSTLEAIDYSQNNMEDLAKIKDVLKINNTLKIFDYGQSKSEVKAHLKFSKNVDKLKNDAKSWIEDILNGRYHNMSHKLDSYMQEMLEENSKIPEKALARVIGNYLFDLNIRGHRFSTETENRLEYCKKNVDEKLLDNYLKTINSSLKEVLNPKSYDDSILNNHTDIIFLFSSEAEESIDSSGNNGFSDDDNSLL